MLLSRITFLGTEKANENVFWRHLASREVDRAQFCSPLSRYWIVISLLWGLVSGLFVLNWQKTLLTCQNCMYVNVAPFRCVVPYSSVMEDPWRSGVFMNCESAVFRMGIIGAKVQPVIFITIKNSSVSSDVSGQWFPMCNFDLIACFPIFLFLKDGFKMPQEIMSVSMKQLPCEKDCLDGLFTWSAERPTSLFFSPFSWVDFCLHKSFMMIGIS